MGLNSIDADLNRPDEVTNLFDVDMWWSAPVETFSIENTNSLETIPYETSTNIGLQNSNELSSLKTADRYGRISTVDSTGNAPKSPCTQPVHRACIMQDDHPVAYYSRKLNSAQRNYAAIDKELSCVIATLREFQSMLLGAELHIYKDHRISSM